MNHDPMKTGLWLAHSAASATDDDEKFDFSGYATKNGLKCADGRTIQQDAFKEQDGTIIPLVWQHQHNNPDNVLGHALLENRKDGVYAYCKFNDSDAAKNAKILVEHGDVNSLSIFANQLVQKGSNVVHGKLLEVSLVLAGANPGAMIDNVTIQHGEIEETVDDEAVIYSGGELSLEEIEHAAPKQASSEDLTVQDILDSMTEEQQNVVYALISHALESGKASDAAAHAALESLEHSLGGKQMKKNVFDNSETIATPGKARKHLSHSQLQTLFADAQKCGSLKQAFLAHVQDYGIENIDYLFPDAKTITSTPDLISRDQAWVNGVISGTRHTPFSRIKSVHADITEDEARALGYIKGHLKKEEIFPLLKRTTSPTTIYKKQKLDRDDILDITDLDVVAFVKSEMQIMIREEIARAVLISDGRDIASDDKIKDPEGTADGIGIRSIYKDNDLYAEHVAIASTSDLFDMLDDITRSLVNYKGSGSPTFYIDQTVLTSFLLLREPTTNRRIYPTVAELASVIGVSSIVAVPVMANQTRTSGANTLKLLGIIVNLSDYSLGADKGGEISMFDDFDLDYNQYRYLLETRCSGALTKPKSALVIEQIIGASS